MMRFTQLILLCFIVGFSVQQTATAQEKTLLEISAQEVKKLENPYEFRIASFAQNEGSYGNGALILLISNDTNTAVINLQGVRTELRAMQVVKTVTCVTGATRQQVYAKGQLRLAVKFKLRAGEEACWADGLVSIRTDKHTNRYLVKGVSGL
ncbi:hypothetical protein [Undibacterium danionis]|uniref:Uncharacterized protein n=1 Tax=Undibacterium danionis TaxID=1812100 RepID=A0ABV6IDQ1_9BURK